MIKNLLKFQFDTVVHNKTAMFRICFILAILVILSLLFTMFLGTGDNETGMDSKSIETEKKYYPENLEEAKEDLKTDTYEELSGIDKQYSRYRDELYIAELELYIKTDTWEGDYYSLVSYFEAYYVPFNPASRLLHWNFFSTMILFAFAALFPLAFSGSKDRYKNLIILGNSKQDIAISEMIAQHIALILAWLVFLFVGSMVGIGSHKIMAIQYNNGNAITISVYAIYLLRQLLVLIASGFILSFGIVINTLIKNKLISSLISLSIFVIPMIALIWVSELALSCYDGGLMAFPIFNLTFDEWIVGNYKLIGFIAIYLVLEVLLSIAKTRCAIKGYGF